MESKTIITDLRIETELNMKSEYFALVSAIRSLITSADNEIVSVDTNIINTNKLIFAKKGIPIVLLRHDEYHDYNVKKYYISVEFIEYDQYKLSHELLVEFINLLKCYNIPYKLTKITFALDLALQDFNSINIEKNGSIYSLKKAHSLIETKYTQRVRQQTTNNQLRLLITVENTQFCLDHFIIEEVLQSIKFHIDKTKVVTPDDDLIFNYLNKLFK